MAFTDDFAQAGAAADNFDCDATGGWTALTGTDPGGTFQAATIALNTIQPLEGTGCLSIKSGNATAGLRGYYQDVTAGSRFIITQTTLNVWFNYAKGKGAQILTSTSGAVRLRLYFGGTVDWAEYNLTEAGNDSLNFGWQVLQCSGRNLNGGAVSGTWVNTASNWDREIHRVAIVFDVLNPNDAGADPGLLVDMFFTGNKIVVSEGTTGGTPATFQDLVDYQKIGGTRTGFPLGLVNLDGVFATLRCGLDIGNGTDGLNNEGYLQVGETFLLFNQWSAQVKHNIVVKNFAQLDFGEGESVIGVDGTNVAAVRGCQVVMPTDREDEVSTTLPAASDVSVENGGILNAYNTKFFRWRDIFLGAASDTSSTVELINVIFDSCETVYFRANTLDLANIEIYNNAQNDRNHCGEMIVSPDSCSDLLVHDCNEGIHFRATLTIPTYRAQDNTVYDLAILEGDTATLVDSFFDPDKILRLAA
ncbi:MAG: hypothetical protein QNJ81_02260 [Acidimicrobiia bacterium]|nr:hypothetical protein [Acidimicrobiia bacterium]